MTNHICPICNFEDIDIFIEISQIPIYCNILYKSREEALNANLADMKLGFCSQCGHVFNYAFDPELLDYTLDYENSLHFSPRFQAYADSLAARLVKRYQLTNKDIIEIGCGDGDFLEMLGRDGKNRCYGFDPSHVPDLDKTGEDKGITFIRDYYSEKYSNYKADLICCRHVLEHIQRPCEFLETVRAAIGKRTETVIFFEVPNALYTLKDLGIWDLIYEHCSYFSPHSLHMAFERSGFDPQHASVEFEGQFITIEAIPASGHADEMNGDGLEGLDAYVDEFEISYTSKIHSWREKLNEWKRIGRTAALWGAGSKGAMFLNNFKQDDQIQCIVDINPRKQGRFVAGTGHEIVAPKDLPTHDPDKIIIMNSIYKEEIRRTVQGMGLKAELELV